MICLIKLVKMIIKVGLLLIFLIRMTIKKIIYKIIIIIIIFKKQNLKRLFFNFPIKTELIQLK